MKAKELRDQTDDELATLLETKKRELMNLRFQLAMNQLDNTNKMTMVKRDIARVKTIMTERQLGIQR
jgi:large subunit ribosomal protein L29